MAQPRVEDHLVDGKYSIHDLVDLNELRQLFQQFTDATGFTIGFLDHPQLNILIATGWRKICTQYHRESPVAAANCIKSNRHLLDQLSEPGKLVIEACENGLVDCATPIIMKGKHIASLATGQILLNPPDLERFKRQAREFKVDEKAYLEALREIPVVSEEKLRSATAFLGSMALMITRIGYSRLASQQEAVRLEQVITDRTRMEEAFREREERYRSTLSSMHDLVFVLDRNGVFVDYHAPDDGKLYQPPDVFLGKHFHDVLPARVIASLDAAIAHLKTGAKVETIDYDLEIGGERSSWSANVSPKRDATGDYDGATLVARNMTDRLALEARLRQAEKLTAIGQLAGGVAHDFNNQLGTIMGWTELIMEDLKDPNQQKYAGAILTSTRHAADLTKKLLTFSRKGTFLPVPVDVHGLINEVWTILKRSVDKRIILEKNLLPGRAMVMGDASQLENALLNIALNSRDAMPGGGLLLFETRVVSIDAEACRTYPGEEITPGNYLCVIITDNGCGMSEETKKHIFEPFFTTKAPGQGTGMGLASVYGTVRNHKGLISVDSLEGRGTTVRMYLPIQPGVITPEVPFSPPTPLRGNARILLVDDEELFRNMTEKALTKLGHQVVACRDGVDAVTYYKDHWAGIDLVILDMIMPRQGSMETFMAMRAVNPAVRVLLSSGFSPEGEAQAIMKEGAIDFIGKPYSLVELSQKVAEIIASKLPPKSRKTC